LDISHQDVLVYMLSFSILGISIKINFNIGYLQVTSTKKI